MKEEKFLMLYVVFSLSLFSVSIIFRMKKNILFFREFMSLVVVCWMKFSMGIQLDSHNFMNQDISYNCASNLKCKCFPNETKSVQISCNELHLFAFPGMSY